MRYVRLELLELFSSQQGGRLVAVRNIGARGARRAGRLTHDQVHLLAHRSARWEGNGKQMLGLFFYHVHL